MRERHDTFDGNATDTGLEADDAAEGSGDADGSSSVRADAAIAESRGNGCRRAAAGTAGNAVQVPRVSRRSVMRILGGDAVREFVKIGFAEKDRARFP